MNRHASSGRGGDDESDQGDSSSPLAEGSIEALEAARRNKTRNYLLIVKGVKLVYLLVRRKSLRKSDVEAARREGFKGEAFLGVVRGQGKKLDFHLAAADGYDRAPLKEMTLEKFLRERGDFKCDAKFVLGGDLPSLEFEDSERKHPLVRRFLSLEEGLGKLAPSIARNLDGFPARLKTLRALLIDGEFVRAKSQLSTLEDEIEQAAQRGTNAGDSNRDEAIDQQLKTLTAKLNRISPQIQAAVKASPDPKRQLLEPLSLFQQAIQRRDPASARQALESLARRVAQQQSQQRAAVKPTMASESPPDVAPSPTSGADEVSVDAASSDEVTFSPEKINEAWNSAQREFREAIDTTQTQMASLAKSLMRTGDPDLAWIAEEGLTELLAELRGAAVALEKCASRDPTQLAQRAIPVVARIRKWLADPRVRACEEDELAAQGRLSDSIRRAVRTLDETLVHAAAIH